VGEDRITNVFTIKELFSKKKYHPKAYTTGSSYGQGGSDTNLSRPEIYTISKRSVH
jgi:hypothetical protein